MGLVKLILWNVLPPWMMGYYFSIWGRRTICLVKDWKNWKRKSLCFGIYQLFHHPVFGGQLFLFGPKALFSYSLVQHKLPSLSCNSAQALTHSAYVLKSLKLFNFIMIIGLLHNNSKNRRYSPYSCLPFLFISPRRGEKWNFISLYMHVSMAFTCWRNN